VELSDRQRAWICSALVTGNLVWLGNGLYLEPLAKGNPILFWVVDLLQWVVLPAVLAISLSNFAGLTVKDYGFVSSKEHWMKTLGDSVGVFITAGFLFFLARNVARVQLGVPYGLNLGNAFPQDALLRTVVVIYWSASAGLVESALYVGLPWLLFRGVSSSLPRFVFVLISSALFAVAHWEQGSPVVIGAFVSNVVLCLWYFHYKSLWPIAGGHFLVDVVAFA